jgi:tetratricopeptide (TPR) repeat protein
MKCDMGEILKDGFSGITFGKYALSPLPTKSKDEFKTELLLNFIDVWKEGQSGSNPEKEGEIILSWLSLILRQKIKVNSVRLNEVSISNPNQIKIFFDSPIIFPENLYNLYTKFKSLPLDLLERYLRACECYQQALLTSNNNPSVSFFLLVVSVECLSNKEQDFYEYLIKKFDGKKEISKEEINKIYDLFIEEYGIKKNFINFIMSHYENWNGQISEEEFKKFLSSIYDIRSSFTHKGENLEKYIKFVDNTLKSKSVFTTIKDKKVEFPGLNYLTEIVQKVLIDFLEKQKNSDQDNIPQLALNESLINLEVDDKSSIKKGSFVFTNQIKHRK